MLQGGMEVTGLLLSPPDVIHRLCNLRYMGRMPRVVGLRKGTYATMHIVWTAC